MQDLANTLAEVRRRIEQGVKRRLNEQNTKATLIEPVLRALGWDVENIEEVQREFRLKKKDKPVDYGLLVVRTPRLFIEAKSLGENLDDRRWANQIMGYASVAGVEWIVLTDGNEYRIYNTHAPVSVEEKLFRTVRVAGEDALLQQTLELLAKDRMAENRIEVLWRAEFVDRQVKGALESLFSSDNDMLLVNYVGGKTKNLTAQEVRASLARCEVTLDFPIPPITEKKPIVKAARRTGTKSGSPAQYEATLLDLIEAGLLQPPVRLEREYKGKILTARIEKDGRVRFGRDTFDSISNAGGAARASVIGLRPDGRHPPTNGWTFWKMPGPAGKPVPVDHVRQRFLAKRGNEAAG